MESLHFNEFDTFTSEDWQAAIQREIKEKKIEDFLYTNECGFTIPPFYTKRETIPVSVCVEPFFTKVFIVAENLLIAKDKTEKVLSHGAQLIHLVSPVFVLQELLPDLSNNIQHIFFTPISSICEQDATLIKNSVQKFKNLTIDFHSLFTIPSLEQENKCMQFLWPLIENAIASGNTAQVIHVNASVYHYQGANAIQELAYTLARLHAYVDFYTEKGIAPEKLVSHVSFSTAIGTDYFLEMAKIRAYKILLDNFFSAYTNGLITNVNIPIHAETSLRYFSGRDVHTNMLRATTQAMSAVTAGCHSIAVWPFDVLTGSSDLAERVAMNIPLLLRHEARFSEVRNAADGMYYVDALCQKLVTAAWEKFLLIEREGGYISYLSNGHLQLELEAERKKEMEYLQGGDKIMVGVNAFQIQAETNRTIVDFFKPICRHSAALEKN